MKFYNFQKRMPWTQNVLCDFSGALKMKKLLNKKIKHISLSGISYFFFLSGIYFYDWSF